MRGVMRIPELTLSEVHGNKNCSSERRLEFCEFFNTFHFLILQQKIMNEQIENLPKKFRMNEKRKNVTTL